MVSPAVFAALAAVFVFYLPFPGTLVPALLSFCPVFCRRFLPSSLGLRFPRLKGALRFCSMRRNRTALWLGIAAGLWAGEGLERFAPGLPGESICSVRGKLLDDPRTFSGRVGEDRGMAYLEMKEAGGLLPGVSSIRSSSRGRTLVFFPPGTMPRVKEFGRGAELYMEGQFLPGGPPRFRADSVHVVKAAPAPESFRSAVRSGLLARCAKREWGGLAAALLLGTRESLDDGTALSFRNAGLSHILALSGMHLAFFSAMLAFALRRPLGMKGAVVAGTVLIVLYVVLVGPQPSLVRAAIMYVMGSCLVLTRTARQTLTLLALSFLVQLLWDPASALGVSFILSYLALGGILVFSGPLESLMKGRLPPFLAGGIAASLGAFFAAAPAVMAFFGSLRPAGIAAGLVAAPLSAVFMAFAIAALACLGIPGLGFLLDRMLVLVQTVLEKFILFFSRGPSLTMPPAAACIVFPMIVVLLLVAANRQKKYRSRLAPFA